MAEEFPFRVDALLGAAEQATGLSDFGDPGFREPLRRLIDSMESEARLSPLGGWIARGNLVRTLANRLRIVAEWHAQPQMLAQPVRAPVFIVGLQRTGTTLLQRLLARLPGLRGLQSWEAVAPARPRGWYPNGRDRRIRNARMTERALQYVAPDFFAVHPIEAESQEEDVLLFDPSFFSTAPEALMRIPSFSQWLEDADHRPAYREYAKVMQLLLWQKRGRWLGKTPQHLEHLDVLLDVFPDARIVHTHRDPLRVIASFCSMICHGRGVFSDHVDPREVADHWGRKQLRMLERALAVRGPGSESAFLDVRYADLVADPLGEVKRVCEHIGVPLAAETERDMSGFLSHHTQHRYGVHRYEFDDFGLDRAELDRALTPYRERFGIERE